MDTAHDTTLDTAANESPHEIRIIAPEVTVRAVHRGVKLSVAAFVVCVVALFAAAIATSLHFTEDDGAHIWAMVLMGAVIITILLSAILAPFLKAARSHR